MKLSTLLLTTVMALATALPSPSEASTEAIRNAEADATFASPEELEALGIIQCKTTGKQ
ncbi:hypothetical protein QC764_0047130 [Podospora pseudoanserina]|uniref:Uncharacterized protein n=1 Tax=Podospora pseudoanserina TaxID=2609844 RepID=A0ABR0ICS0_9PEZI|nr:hypothetical protein QC764_0047130 [Podospora pseudoanserina]